MSARDDRPGGEEVPIETSAPSPDVDLGEAAPSVPGEHRGGFQRLPTGPVEVPRAEGGPAQRGMPDTPWAGQVPVRPRRGVAGWALGAALVALIAAFFVGWCFPIGVVAVVVAVVALRRPLESRAVAGWALALGLLSLVYSAGWLLWVAGQLNVE
jgi:hypothetical protein